MNNKNLKNRKPFRTTFSRSKSSLRSKSLSRPRIQKKNDYREPYNPVKFENNLRSYRPKTQ